MTNLRPLSIFWSKIDYSSTKTDAELIAFKAMSLQSTNQPAEANKLLSALAARTEEPAAVAWATRADGPV